MKMSVTKMMLLVALLAPLSGFASKVCFTNAPNLRTLEVGDRETGPVRKAMKITSQDGSVNVAVGDGQAGTFSYDAEGRTFFMSYQSGNVWETIPFPVRARNTNTGYTISYARLNVPMVRQIPYGDCMSGNVRF